MSDQHSNGLGGSERHDIENLFSNLGAQAQQQSRQPAAQPQQPEPGLAAQPAQQPQPAQQAPTAPQPAAPSQPLPDPAAFAPPPEPQPDPASGYEPQIPVAPQQQTDPAAGADTPSPFAPPPAEQPSAVPEPAPLPDPAAFAPPAPAEPQLPTDPAPFAPPAAPGETQDAFAEQRPDVSQPPAEQGTPLPDPAAFAPPPAAPSPLPDPAPAPDLQDGATPPAQQPAAGPYVPAYEQPAESAPPIAAPSPRQDYVPAYEQAAEPSPPIAAPSPRHDYVPAYEQAAEPASAPAEPAPAIPSPQQYPQQDYVPAYEQTQAEPPAPQQEYRPAYADLEEPAVPASPADHADLGEPEDVLAAIAVVDPDSESRSRASRTLKELRHEAASAGRKEKSQRVTIPAFPFDELSPGTPLVAAVFSPSGGVGKTSLSMNIAGMVAAGARNIARKQSQEAGGKEVRVPRVLILDGDISAGSLAVRLTGESTPSIHTLQTYFDRREDQGFVGEDRWPQYFENAPRGEQSMTDFVMASRSIPNLHLLAAPESPDRFYEFGEQEYLEILRMLGRFYDVIIIDCGTDIQLESQRAWLRHAQEVLIVMTPDVDRIWNSAKAARYMAKPRPHPQAQEANPPLEPPLITREKVSLVMHKADVDPGFDLKKSIKETFPWMDEKQKFWIEDVEKDIRRTNNKGQCLSLTNSDYSKMIAPIAKLLFKRYIETRKFHTPEALPPAQPQQQYQPAAQPPQPPAQQPYAPAPYPAAQQPPQ